MRWLPIFRQIARLLNAPVDTGGGTTSPPVDTSKLADDPNAPAFAEVRSLYRRRSTAPYAIRAAKANGTTQDIGFASSGWIDLAALGTFAGSSEARATVIYDQVGNSHHVADYAHALRCWKGSTGAVLMNGLPALDNPDASFKGYASSSDITVAPPADPPAPTTPDPTASPVGTVTQRWVGISTTNAIRVTLKTSGATSVRLKAGTNSALTTGVVFGSAVTPSSTTGLATLTVSGLTAGTQYYYQVELGGGLDSTVCKVKTAPSTAANFAFGFSSCTNATDSAALANLYARNPDMFLHLGDLFYADGTSPTQANYRAKIEAKVQAPNHKPLFANTPVAYTWSDHDFGFNNNVVGSGFSGLAAANAAYREEVPTPALPGGSTGIYYTWTWGRVRFILTDNRSFKSSNSATDNSSKTVLGSTQKQWFKDTITGSSQPLIVWMNEQPWLGTPSSPDDEWFAYSTERTELANFITASGKNVISLNGDMHALAVGGALGVQKVWHASPLNNNSSIKGGPYAQSYPSTGSNVVQQYGYVSIADTGSQITATFRGYSSDGTQRVSDTLVVTG